MQYENQDFDDDDDDATDSSEDEVPEEPKKRKKQDKKTTSKTSVKTLSKEEATIMTPDVKRTLSSVTLAGIGSLSPGSLFQTSKDDRKKVLHQQLFPSAS